MTRTKFQWSSTWFAMVAQRLVLPLLYSLASDAEQDNPFKGIEENLIRNPPEQLEVESCFRDMVTDDLDSSGDMEEVEYLNFINIRGERSCWYQEALTLESTALFTTWRAFFDIRKKKKEIMMARVVCRKTPQYPRPTAPKKKYCG